MRFRTSLPALILLAAAAVMPANAHAQVFSRSIDNRVWVDVNFGIQRSAASEVTFTFPFILFDETAEIGATYMRPSSSLLFDLGAGYMFTDRVGLGASWTRTSVDDEAGIFASIPDPDFFDNFGFDSDFTDPLRRTETALNIHAMFVLTESDRVTVRAHAGPTFFTYDAEMVFNVEWTQTLSGPDNIIDIVSFTPVIATGSGWGFHAGADVNYFFSNNFGIGGGVRFARGTVTLDPEPMSELEQDITVGGFQLLFGARFRFGSR